jgi:gamma-glutamyl hydrolase
MIRVLTIIFILYTYHNVIVLGQQTQPLNNRPIIGIVNEPIVSSNLVMTATVQQLVSEGRLDTSNRLAYFSADYVKWFESGGARVAPIQYDASHAELDALFDSISALHFTGGGESLGANTTYFQTAQYLFNKAIQANRNGDYFPVFGTCQGLQLLSILVAEDHSVLEEGVFDSENLPLALDFTPEAKSSILFGNAPASVWNTLGTKNVTQNLHVSGVAPATYATNEKLASFFNVLSTNVDRKGRPFVSTIEGKTMPVFATQWHPERSVFEWDLQEIMPHTGDAIAAMNYLTRQYVDRARYNHHKFPNPEIEQASLIYQFTPTYTGNSTTQTYPDRQQYFFQP